MDLDQLLDEYELQQDEWSLTAPTFGKDNQLTVIGWSGWRSKNKLYILFCDICKEDHELFGEGYFSSVKNSLVNIKALPCGCAVYPKWTKQQYELICTRKAKEISCDFVEFTGDWLGAYTKAEFYCIVHGKWESTISNFTNYPRLGCPRCHIRAIDKQKQAYINWVVNQDNFVIAVKFGISGNIRKRLKQQNSKSIFKIIPFVLFDFPDEISCKRAEKECKSTLETCIVLKSEMGDGYTETTHPYNLLEILKIYKEHGGEEIEENYQI